MNQTLQQEVLMLRSEVQQLKSILIAHKDCPLIVHQSLPQRTGRHCSSLAHTLGITYTYRSSARTGNCNILAAWNLA